MEVWVEEFLYRGRETGAKQPPAWHVVLATRVDAGFGETNVVTKILSVAQAEAQGYDLKKLLKGINTEALKSHDEIKAERDVLVKEIKKAKDTTEETLAQAANVSLVNDKLQADKGDLQRQLSAIKTAIQPVVQERDALKLEIELLKQERIEDGRKAQDGE